MDDYKQIIANNISQLRRSKGVTQAELAERLNYTDKAVSKWERGESIPDAIVLKKIADMFGVSVDYLFAKEHRSIFSRSGASVSRLRRRITNRKFIVAISIVLIWLIATVVFVILHSTGRSAKNLICFIAAVPLTFVVWLILNSVWFSKRRNFLIISFLMWSALLSLCGILQICSVSVWYILILGIPCQTIICLWSRIRIYGRKIRRRSSDTEYRTDGSEPEPEEDHLERNTPSD